MSFEKWQPFCLGLNVLSNVLGQNKQATTWANN